MTWLVNGKEFQNVTRLNPSERYQYFIKRVADWQELWALWKEDGWAMMGGDGGQQFMTVWPHRIYAEAMAHDSWLGYLARSIMLDEWMEKWLPGLERDQQGIAVFPVTDGSTSTVEPARLKEDLKAELEKM